MENAWALGSIWRWLIVRYKISVDKQIFEIEVKKDGQVWVNDNPIEVDIKDTHNPDLYSLLIDHRSFEAQVEIPGSQGQQVYIAGHPYQTYLLENHPPSREKSAALPAQAQVEITTPLPGHLLEIKVTEGQLLKEGESLAVMETMKMLIEIRTPQAGVVHLVSSKACGEVAQGEVLAIINQKHPPDR